MIKELTQEQIIYLFNFFKEHIDPCPVCQNYTPCMKVNCPHYVNEIMLVGGCDGAPTHKELVSCCDEEWGDCVVLKSTPCHGCMSNHFENFVWNGEPEQEWDY